MKTIDLRALRKRSEGIDVFLPSFDWWKDYLAWQASTLRNWIERRLEPLVQWPVSHLRIIDVETPEEAGIVDGVYPTTDLSAWWTIICLDGAPERMHHSIQGSQPSLLPFAVLRLAEKLFQSIIANVVQGQTAKPVAYVCGDWRDGEILGFALRSEAEDFVSRVAVACEKVNRAEQLPWTEQFHVRAGTGLSLHEAFSGLLQAKRDEHYLVGRTHGETNWGSVRTLQVLAG